MVRWSEESRLHLNKEHLVKESSFTPCTIGYDLVLTCFYGRKELGGIESS